MARRAKIDPRQNSFDFDQLVEVVERLETHINDDDTEANNANRTTQITASGTEGLNAQNNNGDHESTGDQPFRLGDSGSLGNQHPGEAQGPGERQSWPGQPLDSASESAGQGDGNPDQRPGAGTAADRPGSSRDSGDERSGHGTVSSSQAVPSEPSSYRITEADQLGQGGAKTKFKDNIEALKVLKRLQSSGASFASPEDQKALVRYVGWGGLPQAFDLANESWQKESQELREILTPDEYAQARRSTQDAHYTSQEVIEGIYEALERFGVDRKSVV